MVQADAGTAVNENRRSRRSSVRTDESDDEQVCTICEYLGYGLLFYQTNTALYPVKSENSPTTADDR